MKISAVISISITIVLICLMNAMAACPPGSGCIDVYGGGSGEVIGDDNFMTETSLDDWQNDGIEATLTTGTRVLLKIPSGSQGSVKGTFSRSVTTSASPVLNDDQYTMDANFSGSFKLGAEKRSTQGMASAETRIFARSAVDNGFINPEANPGAKKYLISGEASITAKTKSTGTAGTYAIIDGVAAYYRTAHICPTCPNALKEVSGQAGARRIELQSCSSECPDCCMTCEPAAPTGTVTGSALISARSNANYFKSSSYSDIDVNLTAARGSSGSSTISGSLIDVYSLGYARDGSAPSPSGYNAQTGIRSSYIPLDASAFAANDVSTSNGFISSEASHNFGTGNDRAYSEAEVYSAVKRADMNSPSTLARANAAIYNSNFRSDARDLRTSQKYAFEYGTIVNMQSHGQLLSIASIWNRATLAQQAQRSGSNSSSSVGGGVWNYGPKSGISSDFSKAEEHVRDMRAEARSTSETRFADIRSQDVISYIYGQNPYPTKIWAVLGATSGGGITQDTNAEASFIQGVNRVWTLSLLKSND